MVSTSQAIAISALSVQNYSSGYSIIQSEDRHTFVRDPIYGCQYWWVAIMSSVRDYPWKVTRVRYWLRDTWHLESLTPWVGPWPTKCADDIVFESYINLFVCVCMCVCMCVGQFRLKVLWVVMVVYGGIEGGGTTFVLSVSRDDVLAPFDHFEYGTTSPEETLDQAIKW